MPAAVTNRQRKVALSPARLARTAERALAALGRPAGDVDVLVVDDVAIARLNSLHRGVSRRTDVLAFPLEAPGVATPLVGQIVISAETGQRQAHRLGVPLAAELDLLVTHGVLHLVGYDDRDPVEAGLMHEREREILSGGRRLPAQLWKGLLDEQPLRIERAMQSRLKDVRACRSQAASGSGHPRSKPASRHPLQQSRLAPVSGHPRAKPTSRHPLQ